MNGWGKGRAFLCEIGLSKPLFTTDVGIRRYRRGSLPLSSASLYYGLKMDSGHAFLGNCFLFPDHTCNFPKLTDKSLRWQVNDSK